MSDPRTRARNVLHAERCRRSAHYFIFDSKVLFTKDEHDPTTPVKNFPEDLYLRAVLDCLLISGRLMDPIDGASAQEAGLSLAWLEYLSRAGILFIEKSRQVMATWLVCAYLLWRSKMREHQLILVQSKREEDAAKLVFEKEPHVARISFMESHLPKHLRSIEFPGGGSYARLYHATTSSQIWGIPEGGDIIRSNTPTVVFSDESAFQPEFGASYTAALPAIHGGGQYIAVSSAHPGEFCTLVEGEMHAA